MSDVANATTSRTNLVAAKSGANSDITSLTGLTTPLTVAQGGTGAATLTANNVLLGNGTSAPQFVDPSTTGNLLSSNGTTWVSSAPIATSTSQLAKAWAQWRGAAPSVINGSFNISSITTTATGYYTIVFTTPMANANYSAIMSGGTVISGANSSQAIFTDNTAASVAPLTTGFTVTTGSAGWGAYSNLNWVCIAVFSS